jgi:hypothetical protein
MYAARDSGSNLVALPVAHLLQESTVKKREAAKNKTATAIKKLQLRNERIRVLAFTDLTLVEGGTSGETACTQPGDDIPPTHC